MPRDYSKNRNVRSSNRRDNRQDFQTPSSSGLSWMLIGILVGLCIAGVAYLNQSKKHSNNESNLNSPQQMAMNQSTSTAATAKKKTTTNNPQFDFYNMLPSTQVNTPTATEANSTTQKTTDNIAPTTPPPNAAKVNAILSGVTPPPANANFSNTANSNTTNINQNTNTTQVNNSAQNKNSNQNTAQPVSANSVNDDGEVITAPKNAPNATTAISQSNNTAQASATPATSSQNSSQYVIQLAAFSHYQQADRFKAQLALSGYEAKIVSFQKNGRTLQRVWLGPFTSLSAAASVQRQLADNQIKSTLVKADVEEE